MGFSYVATARSRFAYVVDCTSDLSPNVARLLLVEGGSKAIFRGHTRVNDPSGTYGGDRVPDPAKEKWKPALFSRAESEWKRVVAK